MTIQVVNFPGVDATLVAPLQVVASATALTLNTKWGAPFRFGRFCRSITLTSASNLGAITFEIKGTDVNGNAAIETISGPNNNTVTTAAIFRSITSIESSGGVEAASLSVGSGATGQSLWQFVNNVSGDYKVVLATAVTGTINYTVNQGFAPQNNITINTQTAYAVDSTLTSATTTLYFVNTVPASSYQLVINSSSGGSMNLTILQQGVL